jgi:hypothetical protein
VVIVRLVLLDLRSKNVARCQNRLEQGCRAARCFFGSSVQVRMRKTPSLSRSIPTLKTPENKLSRSVTEVFLSESDATSKSVRSFALKDLRRRNR